MTTRQERLEALDDEYGGYMRKAYGEPFNAHMHPADRYVLVERNTYDRSTYYVTIHGSPEGAAEYHDGQEYPDDWTIEFLENVDTGQRYEGTTKTTFEEIP